MSVAQEDRDYWNDKYADEWYVENNDDDDSNDWLGEPSDDDYDDTEDDCRG